MKSFYVVAVHFCIKRILPKCYQVYCLIKFIKGKALQYDFDRLDWLKVLQAQAALRVI